MRVEIRLVDDAGGVIAEHSADAAQPTSYKRRQDDPIFDGKYEIFGFTYQPHVRVTGKEGGF